MQTLVELWPNYLTHCPAGSVLRTFVQYLITFCSRSETVGEVISGMVIGPVALDKHVKFHDPNLNRSREIPPEAVGIFDRFLSITSYRKQGMTLYPV